LNPNSHGGAKILEIFFPGGGDKRGITGERRFGILLATLIGGDIAVIQETPYLIINILLVECVTDKHYGMVGKGIGPNISHQHNSAWLCRQETFWTDADYREYLYLMAEWYNCCGTQI